MLTRQPDFLIGGTSAGGTSFLSAILVQHPQIYLPKKMRPEPHFFYKSWEYQKGHDYYVNKWFKNVPNTAKAVGERSSSYMFGENLVAERVKSFNPNMKFIFTLRNPIERAWANYRYTVLEGLEENSFEDALNNEEERIKSQKGIWSEIQPFNYTGRGFYFKQIKSFMEHFPKNNILLLKSELLSSQTKVEIKKILNFLNIRDSNFDFNNVPNHTSCNVINPSLQVNLRKYFKDKFDLIIEAIRKNQNIFTFSENEEDDENLKKLKDNIFAKKQKMSFDSRNYLQKLYKDDINNLKSLIDFELKDWK